MSLPVVEDLAPLYAGVDQGATVALLAKLSVERMLHKQLKEVRNDLNTRVMKVGTPAPLSPATDLLLPHTAAATCGTTRDCNALFSRSVGPFVLHLLQAHITAANGPVFSTRRARWMELYRGKEAWLMP